MKTISLTKGMFAIVDDDDFEFISKQKWFCDSSGYAACGADIRILMHRVINKTPDGLDTDHINGNRLDNRKNNLRTATRAQNAVNRKKQSNNTSGFKDVAWHKRYNKWHAYVIKNKKMIHLGYYKSKNDAAAAVDKKALELSGNFARVNLACSKICA